MVRNGQEINYWCNLHFLEARWDNDIYIYIFWYEDIEIDIQLDNNKSEIVYIWTQFFLKKIKIILMKCLCWDQVCSI